MFLMGLASSLLPCGALAFQTSPASLMTLRTTSWCLGPKTVWKHTRPSFLPSSLPQACVCVCVLNFYSERNSEWIQQHWPGHEPTLSLHDTNTPFPPSGSTLGEQRAGEPEVQSSTRTFLNSEHIENTTVKRDIPPNLVFFLIRLLISKPPRLHRGLLLEMICRLNSGRFPAWVDLAGRGPLLAHVLFEIVNAVP